MNIRIDNPCRKITLLGLQPESCFKAGIPLRPLPRPDSPDAMFGTFIHRRYSYLGPNQTIHEVTCVTYQTVTREAEEIGLTPGMPMYDFEVTKALLLLKQRCIRMWTDLQKHIDIFVLASIQQYEGQVHRVREPNLRKNDAHFNNITNNKSRLFNF